MKFNPSLRIQIHRDAKQYSELDVQRPSLNPCMNQDKEDDCSQHCRNRETMEDLFVAMTAHWFATQLNQPFNEIIYSPNSRVEKRCGFDLSVGAFNSEKVRLRLQHKVLRRWIDRDMNKTLSQPHISNQIQALCNAFKKDEACRPFLVVHQCKCIHDYRRMGVRMVGSNEVVPNLTNPLRTLCIDLSSGNLPNMLHEGMACPIRICTSVLEESTQAFAILNDEQIELKVLALDDLQKLVDKNLV